MSTIEAELAGPSRLSWPGPTRAENRGATVVALSFKQLAPTRRSVRSPAERVGQTERNHLPRRMDWLVEIAQPSPRASRSSGNDLSRDAHRGFLRCARSQVKANRTRQPGQLGICHTGGAQARQAIAVGLPGTHRADVSQLGKPQGHR